MRTGSLFATIHNEISKIGPSPQGCGENRSILSFSPSTVGPAHSLRARPRLTRYSLAPQSAPVRLV
jgi:hypothetical protein